MNNGIKEEIITKTSDETQQFGKDFAQKIKAGDVIALHGDLGSGKTTFTQGLAKGLGIRKRIISPTFVIVRTYKLADSKNFYHIDLYRIEHEKDLESLGIEEILANKDNIVAIEWPEKLGSYLSKKRFDITFEYIDENIRKITWKNI